VTEDCRNDCVERLRFPRVVDNRAGLSHIKYRLGSYADIREALLRNLDKTPGLSRWTHRGADDPGIALLEGASILGDILTFYQELYANEAYLRTAQWRDSIADLVRLLGYRLSPGLGGQTTFAFEVKGDQPVTIPASFPVKAEVEGLAKPADFETGEPAIAYPWLSKFHLYRQLDAPDITQATTEFYISSPDQFLMQTELKPNDRLLIGEANDSTSPSARAPRLDNSEVVTIDSVRELHGQKIYKIKGALKRTGNIPKLTAFKIGRSFHHFGRNGPRTLTKPPASVTSTATSSTTLGVTTTTTTSPGVVEKNVSFSKFLNTWTSSSGQAFGYPNNPSPVVSILLPSLDAKDFALDAEVQDLSTGRVLVIQATLYNYYNTSQTKDFTFVRKIDRIKAISLTWGLVTGPTSLVTLDQSLNVVEGSANYLFTDIRDFVLNEALSPPLELRAGVQETTLTSGNELYFLGTESQAQSLKDRRLFFVKPGADPAAATVVDVPLDASLAARPLLHAITLDRDVSYADFPNEKPTVTVYGNLVDATEGKREPAAPLGNGDNRLVFQTFKVPKAPVTYLISSSDTPPEVPELQIYVNDRLWKRVQSFFDRQPDEEIYIVREDADNHSWVQFGDGQTGARLPSGVKNVVARYRTGTGAFGALKPSTKVQAGGKLERLDKIQMPDVVAGGSQPEDGESARDAAPGKIQSLNRLVSLEDFESETLAISGVTKAAAAWQLEDNIPAVVVTVLMATGRSGEIDDVRATLAGYNQGRGPSRFPVSVLQGELQYVVIDATFGYDSTYREEDVRKAIQKALGVNSGKPNVADDQSGLFSLRQRGFGHREYATSVAGTIQQVAGVTWAYVTRFESLGTIADPTVVTPPATRIVILPIVSCDSQKKVLKVLSLYAGHLQLTGVAETVPEVKR
jgi:hypothetical protein